MDRALHPGVGIASSSGLGTGLRDPVCGMTVTPKSFHSLEHGGQRIYFCGVGCKARFAARPDRFRLGAALPVARRSDGAASPVLSGRAATPICPTLDDG
jgi:YHS domain-containing protein